MRRLVLPLLCALALAAWPAEASAQTPTAWVADWLREYAAPDTRAAVIARLPTVVNVSRLQEDLDLLLEGWLKEGASETVQRQVIAAFALEAAHARLGVGKPAVDLVEWGCRQVRRLREPGEFERRWHLAAFALFSGAVDPDALESHASHMRLQFRTEPRLVYERAVAEELRAAPFFEGGRASARDVEKRYEEAAKRYREAAEQDEVRVEARLRLARVELELGRAEEAVTILDDLLEDLEDDDLRYLAHLFRGRAFERLDRPAEARTAYGLALAVRPRAQSASMALAALLFQTGQRGVAHQIVAELLGRANQPDDPWWMYWPADYRRADELMMRMREALP
jgi:tetratricopeptide (TPR) repeat protein